MSTMIAQPLSTPDPRVHAWQSDEKALLCTGSHTWSFKGQWITGDPWERFGRYNYYVVVRDDGEVRRIPAHAGELVPGSTEDLIAVLQTYDPAGGRPLAPMTLELDPTYRCASKDCGGRCFSAPYRKLAPAALISSEVLQRILVSFAAAGGRVVRFDGGGDPLAHPAVRNGDLPELADGLGLKSTILTAGDLLADTDLERIGRANCYVRVSLNAATNETRSRFHGNRILLSDILLTIRRYANWLDKNNHGLPIGATFLLDDSNYLEVLDCARQARDYGISHFSVRRVLGPRNLRPVFSPAQEEAVARLLDSVSQLGTKRFLVFVPWRPLHEPDLNPATGELKVNRCWQSTFKTVIEPDPGGVFRGQLCGRYRGSGIGQAMEMPPLISGKTGDEWVEGWRRSFEEYRWSRESLPRLCSSCIDRGFILLVDRLMSFLGDTPRDFHIFHLRAEHPTAQEGEATRREGKEHERW